MGQALIPIDPTLLSLLKGAFGADGLPQPFVKEIFLLECHVAGTSYVSDIEDLEPRLEPQAVLVFKREPANPHDPLAILILDQAGHKLGYVPRDRNEVLARLLDAGKLIFGRLERKEWVEDWLKLEIRAYLRDL
jgi:HIRAN domain